jgi:hypothetical protein
MERKTEFENSEYIYDDLLSTPEVSVTYHMKRKKVYITHRGSKTLLDWAITDPLSAKNAWSPRKYRAIRVTGRARDKYNQEPVQIGHSLGGYLAEHAGKKEAQVATYNKIGFGRDQVVNKNQVDITRPGDVVSVGFYRNNGITLAVPRSKNPVYAHGFEGLTKRQWDRNYPQQPTPSVLQKRPAPEEES